MQKKLATVSLAEMDRMSGGGGEGEKIIRTAVVVSTVGSFVANKILEAAWNAGSKAVSSVAKAVGEAINKSDAAKNAVEAMHKGVMR